jgi:hypothetical protein
MTENWIDIAQGYDREDVKARARIALSDAGQDADKLGPEQIRLDAGTDAEGRGWFRVRVTEAVLVGREP